MEASLVRNDTKKWNVSTTNNKRVAWWYSGFRSGVYSKEVPGAFLCGVCMF